MGKHEGLFHFHDVNLIFRFIYAILTETMVIIHEKGVINIKKEVINYIFKLVT